jgi:hypothetical protein
MKAGVIIIATAMIGILAFSISAAPVKIDFTDTYYQSIIDNTTNATGWIPVKGFPALEVNLSTAEGSNITFNIESGKPDGIGIGDDEISGDKNQTLTLEFSMPVNVIGFEVLDLFLEKAKKQDNPGDAYFELGYYQTAGNTVHSFRASGESTAQEYGYLDVGVTGDGMGKSISFWSEDNKADGDHDYALSSITMKSIPEPATLSVFGLGLLAMAGFKAGRRKMTN